MSTSPLSRLAPTSALRQLKADETPNVTNMELFFDLVYVFTIIQLSHYLLEHQSWLGALQFAILFAAVWWAWNYTAWATNWLNPDHKAGRLFMVVLMACALLMAIAMPYAYSETATLFVGAYIVMGLFRAGYMALLFRGQQMGQNYAQLFTWSAIAAIFWIAGAVFPESRTVLWLIAVLIDYTAPFTGFWLPSLGATSMDSWPLSGLHLLERNQQVFIIALGESILLLGGTLVGTTISFTVGLAAAFGFGSIVLLWWLYFVRTTSAGEEVFEQEGDHTELARSGLAYSHGVMVCGAIIVAVAIEQIIAHPDSAVHLPVVIVTTLGPIIYLLGSVLFYRSLTGQVPLRYLLAIATLAVWGVVAALLHVSGLVLGVGVFAILLGLIAATKEHSSQSINAQT